jgi:hypothetical protein
MIYGVHSGVSIIRAAPPPVQTSSRIVGSSKRHREEEMKNILLQLLLIFSLAPVLAAHADAQEATNVALDDPLSLAKQIPATPTVIPARDPAFALPQPILLPTPEARVKSNTQVVLPENLFLGDMNGDGIDDFIQVSGTSGAGNHNRILVFGTDYNSTGMMHLYLNTDVVKVFTGNFRLSTEPSYGPDQLCVTTESGLLNCYMSKDGTTLSLMWSEPNFILPDEQIIVGDFDGNGADDFLLYRPSTGTFRMMTRTNGTQVGTGPFGAMAGFAPGALGSGKFVNFQFRAGQWGTTAGPDGLIAYNPANGEVTLFNSVLSGGSRTFSAVFTANTNPPSANAETLSTGRLLEGPTDGLVLRNNSTGAYRFFTPDSSIAHPGKPAEMIAATGVAPGQLPVVAAAGQLVFARLAVSPLSPGAGNSNVSNSLRDDTLFFNATPGQFISTGAAYDATAKDYTYWWAFTQNTSTRDQGWPAVERDLWLFLRCQFADYPTLEDPLFNYDSYVQNEFGQAGTGLGGFVDFYRQITYGKIDYNVYLAPGWYPTIPTTQYKNGGERYLAASTCAKNYGHGITAASFSGSNYIGPTYAGIVTLWNKQHDGGNDGGNLTVLDSSWVGTDMAGAAHEGLHAYGLAHPHTDQDVAFCYGTSTEYCDDWDPMGGAPWYFNPSMSTYNLPANNPAIPANLLPKGYYGGAIEDGSEINAPNRIQLNAMPTNRILTLTPQLSKLGKQQVTVTLAALERPEANGYLVVKIPHCDPNGSPKCDDPNQFFTVELRLQTGWDVNILQATVLVHEVFTYGRAAYIPGKGASSFWTEYLKTRTVATSPGRQEFLAGEFLPATTASYSASSTLYPDPVPAGSPTPPTQIADPSSPLSITVQSFNSAASTATVVVVY